MSITDDTDAHSIQRMVRKLAHCRKTPGELDRTINAIADGRGISRTPTMENYTRFPMAAFPWSGWGVKKGRGIIHITDQGKLVAQSLRQAPDIRLFHFNAFPDSAKPAFIRWTFYSMLQRAGFNMDPVRKTMSSDVRTLAKHKLPSAGNVYFSPFQQLSRANLVKWTPDLVPDAGSVADHQAEKLVEAMSGVSSMPRARTTLIFELSEHVAAVADSSTELIYEIRHALHTAGSIESATDALAIAYGSANKDVFYPLVANLFCVIGLDCHVSRGGQNYERADAIILDKKRCIPIEIKSPGEEPEISVKGIRQALENKVVLLSRKSYPTDKETTSLVVGFNPPNDRSEVHELIENIRAAFGIRVGVIDFRSLLALAVQTVSSEKKLRLRDFHLLQGVIRVERLAPKS